MALVAASVAAPLVIRHRLEVEWKEKEARLRAQAEQVEDLSRENQKLSNLVAETRNSAPLSNGQLKELLRLRGEVGQLRQAARDIENLKGTSRQSPAVPEGTDTTSPPEDQTVLAHWPKAELAAAGYSDPASALRTALWAMSRGDGDAMALSVTPESRADLERQDWPEHKSPREEMAERGKWIAESLAPASGFDVVGQRQPAEDRAILDVFFEGEGRTRRFEMKKTGGAWKFNTMGLPGVREDDFASAWP